MTNKFEKFDGQWWANDVHYKQVNSVWVDDVDLSLEAAWFGGGLPVQSTIDRIIFSNDTATATVKGPLSLARYVSAASGNSTDAWFGGGGYPEVSTVDRIIFSNDTATASVKGPLSSARYGLAAN